MSNVLSMTYNGTDRGKDWEEKNMSAYNVTS